MALTAAAAAAFSEALLHGTVQLTSADQLIAHTGWSS